MPADVSNSNTINIAQSVQLLRSGALRETHGLLPWGSNFTYLLSIGDGAHEALAVYKPRRGERPLWDFPEGTLCQREAAAFLISEALGWHIVPPTVLRDGPQGIGMVQIYVDHNAEQHYFTFGPEHKEQLRRIALFDLIINNADRKGGHCLLDRHGKIWAIDHGVCFHSQPKLRSVIWDFAGQPIPAELLLAARGLVENSNRDDLRSCLTDLLNSREIQAILERIVHLVETGVFPEPGPGRQYPWPPV